MWRDVSVGQIGNLKVWRVPARKPVMLHSSEQSPSIVCGNPMVFGKFGRLDLLEFSRLAFQRSYRRPQSKASKGTALPPCDP